MVLVSVFGDESADGARQRAFALSGIAGTEAEWIDAEHSWGARLCGREFHAAACETEYANDRDSQKHRNNLGLYKDLTEILAGSQIAGIGVALDIRSFRELVGGMDSDAPYFLCLHSVLVWHSRAARQFNERNPSEHIELDFTFDHRIESDGTAGALYSTFINQPEWTDSGILSHKVSFGCRSNLRVQMADLVARETMKEMERRLGYTDRPQRLSFRALEASGHFRFVWLDRRYCEEFRAELENPRTSNFMERYTAWLHDTRRVQRGAPHDTLTNRLRFAALADVEELLGARRDS